MIKKLTSYLGVIAITIALLAPLSASAGSFSLSSKVVNATKGEKAWVSQTAAVPGDNLIFSMVIVNNTATPVSGVAARAVLPNGLELSKGYTKLYYLDANDQEKVMAIANEDALIGSGVNLIDLGANRGMYLTYVTKVSANANGSYAPTNQVVASGGVSLASSSTVVNVAGVSQPSANTNDGNGSTNGIDPATAASVTLKATLYNATKGETVYSSSTAASRGDNVVYRMTIINNGGSVATGIAARVVLPNGLTLKNGYAKLYYLDANDQEKVMPINNEAALIGSGVNLTDLRANRGMYLTYVVTVKSDAVAGPYATSNQVVASGGVSLADNSAVINVSAPAPQPASVTLKATLYNATKGETVYSSSTAASRGDNVVYRMTIINNGGSVATGIAARVVLPNGLTLKNGYAKLYYLDANDQEKVMPINNEAALIGSGVNLTDLRANRGMYLTYVVTVKSDAVAGPYATSNQVVASGGVSLADNSAIVNVGVEQGTQRILFLDASAYNVTAAKSVGFADNISANKGDIVKIRVDFGSVGNTKLTNVKIANILPANLTFVSGSMKVVLGGNVISTGDNIVTSGATFGDLNVGATGYMEFNAKVKSDVADSVTQLVYKATGSADEIAQVSSLVNINLANTSGNDELPDTGPASGTITALILLALFIVIAGYIYARETKLLQKATKLIRK